MKTRRRGFVMVVAIVLLGLIGVALASLTEQTAADLKRLHIQTGSAQARQILIAATRLLVRNPEQPISLPTALIESRAALHISTLIHEPNHIVLRLDALSEKVRMSETLTLTRQQGGWNLTDAQLQ